MECRSLKDYSDAGKSGLNIEGREALGTNDSGCSGRKNQICSSILVYDVSRWGRFQDADESAYYEYICRRAGVAVHYCAEQFENDGSPVSTIVKGVKRAMAGEYSRELSSKVFQGACRLIQLGFKQGGTAGFGLRRMLIDQSGEKKAMLKMGEQKSIQTDRVVLVRGPDEEVKIVRWIYHDIHHGRKNGIRNCHTLNAQGMVTDFGRAWNRATVHQVLTNEKYIGNNVYHRDSFKLKRSMLKIRRTNGFEPTAFMKASSGRNCSCRAREIILARSRKLTDDEMLEKLRGRVKPNTDAFRGILIDETDGLPSSTAFSHRFGSLIYAYRLIGYDPRN